MSLLSIIIVSFNARAELAQCLESLHQPAPVTSHEVIVVDNASSDGSAAAARQWAGVRTIETGANLGFARATNIGIRESRGDLLLWLNSDTVVPAGAIDRLVEILQSSHDVSVVGPRLVDAGGHPELSFGAMLGPFNELRQKLLVRGHDRRVPVISNLVDRWTREPVFPDWVSGACLLVRRVDAEAVGLLDERYFMYAEDVDFCAAIRRRGGRIRFSPEVTIVHLRGQSVSAAPAATAAAYRQSQLAFYTKHHPRWLPLLRFYLRLRGVR